MTVLLLSASVGAAQQLPEPGEPGAPQDIRYCGEPRRERDGTIYRDKALLRRFAQIWPKPDDGRQWYIDHVIPLAVGGCDHLYNLQWLPGELKTCAGHCKDRWERKIYAPRPR